MERGQLNRRAFVTTINRCYIKELPISRSVGVCNCASLINYLSGRPSPHLQMGGSAHLVAGGVLGEYEMAFALIIFFFFFLTFGSRSEEGNSGNEREIRGTELPPSMRLLLLSAKLHIYLSANPMKNIY